MIGQGYTKTKEFVRAADLFCTTDLIRYRDNPQYRSLTGGLCSIAVFIAFVALFAGTILNTFNKNVIIASTIQREETTPSLFSTTSTPFLFALGINGIDLNDPNTKYFNVQFSQRTKLKNVGSTRVSHSLVPCDRNVWTSVDERLGQTFDRLQFSQWLCLPQGVQIEFQGKFSSNVFKYVKISVENCTADAGSNRTCIDPSMLSTDPYSFNYYFVNSIINPDSANYLDTYLQDRNYFRFSTRFGVTANIFYSTFEIQTDQSLWPLQDQRNDEGAYVFEPAQQFVTEGEQFIQLYLRKSSLSIHVDRAFKKYDDTISYLGGLFSSAMVALFVMFKYNQLAYEVDIASQIYSYDHGKKIKAGSFDFMTFLGYAFYSGVEMVKQPPDWPKMKHFDDARQEISKQLDIKLILKQLSFLEDCMTYLFEDYELDCLHLKRKLTLQQAKSNRKRFDFRGRFVRWRQMQDISSKQENPTQKGGIGQGEGNESANSMKMTQRLTTVRKCTQIPAQYNTSQLQSMQASSGPENWGAQDKWEVESDISEEAQEQARKLYDEMMSSMMRVKVQAERGNSRCNKIFGNLDQMVVPSFIDLTEGQKAELDRIRESAIGQEERRKEWKKINVVANEYNLEVCQA